jgi:hypothetical protein
MTTFFENQQELRHGVTANVMLMTPRSQSVPHFKVVIDGVVI